MHGALPLPSAHAQKYYRDGEITLYPQHTACWAIYAHASNPQSFWSSIFTAILAGGDTDTCAACAGGCAGAFHGLAALRAERPGAAAVLRRIGDSTQPGACDVAALRDIARRLHDVATDSAGGRGRL